MSTVRTYKKSRKFGLRIKAIGKKLLADRGWLKLIVRYSEINEAWGVGIVCQGQSYASGYWLTLEILDNLFSKERDRMIRRTINILIDTAVRELKEKLYQDYLKHWNKK